MSQHHFLKDLKFYGSIQKWTLSVNGIVVKCEAIRNGIGCWCGYVYHQNRDGANEYKIHGGITFWGTERLGFDCGHYGDYSPIMFHQGRYRDFPWVKGETESLARQIFKI